MNPTDAARVKAEQEAYYQGLLQELKDDYKKNKRFTIRDWEKRVVKLIGRYGQKKLLQELGSPGHDGIIVMGY